MTAMLPLCRHLAAFLFGAVGQDLNDAARAELVARRRDLYIRLHPETKGDCSRSYINMRDTIHFLSLRSLLRFPK